MSFGYAVGDVIVIGKLAWSVYKACIDAPTSFGNIAQEVIALEVVIRQFGEAFEGQELSELEQKRLDIIGKGCRDVLKDLQSLVEKYENLGLNAKLSFDRLKWAAAPVDELRTRLISNTTILSAFIQTSPVVILKHVKKIVQQYQDGKREGSIFSSLSSVDSLISVERTQWRTIRKELEDSGLTLAILDSNRELILECLTAALGITKTQDRATSPAIEGKGKGKFVDSRSPSGQRTSNVHAKKSKGKERLVDIPSLISRYNDASATTTKDRDEVEPIKLLNSDSEQDIIVPKERDIRGKFDHIGPSTGRGITLNPFVDSAYELPVAQLESTYANLFNDEDYVTPSEEEDAETSSSISQNTIRTSHSRNVEQADTGSLTIRKPDARTGLPQFHPRLVVNILPKFLLSLKRGQSEDARLPKVDLRNQQRDEVDGMEGVPHPIRKVLFLGPSQSGKSTLFKQINALKTPLSINMRKEFRERIIFNILHACHLLIKEMVVQEIGSESTESLEAERIIMETQGVGSPIAYLPKCYAAIRTLEQTAGFQATLRRGHEFALYDNLTYYLTALERIFAVGYVPSIQDIMHCSSQTTGIAKTTFGGVQGKPVYHVIDIGGSRAGQRKWIHAFQHVSVVVFMAPISGYARCLFEDGTMNVMTECLRLFKHLLETHWFKKSRIVLLLTKVDQLQSILSYQPIQDCWPDYRGDPKSETDVIRYFTARFLSMNADRERLISVKCVNLIDEEAVHRLLEDEIFILEEELPSWKLLKIRRENQKSHH